MAHNGTILHFDDPEHGPWTSPRPPARFGSTPSAVDGTPPARMGQHTDEVLREVLEMQESEIDSLRAAGVLGKKVGS